MNKEFRNKQKGCSVMKNAVKKVIIYSLLFGIAQFGLSASIVEASPRSDWQQQQNDQQSQENDRHNREMQRHGNENDRDWHNRQVQEDQQHERYIRQDNERHSRNEIEMQRHEKELERRDHESRQDWNERQLQENRKHEEMVHQIEADVIRRP